MAAFDVPSAIRTRFRKTNFHRKSQSVGASDMAHGLLLIYPMFATRTMFNGVIHIRIYFAVLAAAMMHNVLAPFVVKVVEQHNDILILHIKKFNTILPYKKAGQSPKGNRPAEDL
jgi:hypothetical protein